MEKCDGLAAVARKGDKMSEKGFTIETVDKVWKLILG